MRYHNGTADEHGGYPPDRGGGVHAPQYHQALRKRPHPRFLLQLSGRNTAADYSDATLLVLIACVLKFHFIIFLTL